MSNRRATIEFTDVTKMVLKQLEASGFNVRVIVNGAILAFGKLSGDEQKDAITKAFEEKNNHPRQQLRDAMAFIKEMVDIERQQPGTIYRVLDNDEQKVLDEFRKLVSPEGKKRSKKA
jgi:hypothetical protein